jgi:hypothetical protein
MGYGGEISHHAATTKTNKRANPPDRMISKVIGQRLPDRYARLKFEEPSE